MATKAVIFDFGGVLCFPPDQGQIERAAQIVGLPADEFWHAFWIHRVAYDAGKISPEQYWREFAKFTDIPFDEARLPQLIRAEVELWNRYDQRVLGWARQLKDEGIGTAVLSNLPMVLGDELKATPGFLDPFDHLTFSYELGMVKPERGIYEHALDGLAVAGAEAVFLDDRKDNVEGALSAGLQAELFSTWEAFLASAAFERHGLPRPR